MARSDSIDSLELDSIAKGIGPFLNKGGRGEGLGVGESFQLWTMRLSKIRFSGGISFETRARWHRVWHHQLRRISDGVAVAYARSLQARSGSFEIRSVYFSPLAQAIDSAIGWIDEHWGGDDVGLVRLLVVPELEEIVIWVSAEEGNKFIPLDAGRLTVEMSGGSEDKRKEVPKRSFSSLSEDELREVLQGREPIIGARQGNSSFPNVDKEKSAGGEGDLAERKK